MSQKIDEKPEGKNDFQSERVFIISGGHFVHDTFSAFLAPLLPLLIEKLSLTLTMAGSLSASMQFAALLNPLIGRLADKSSARYFVVFAPAVTATLMASMGLALFTGVGSCLLFTLTLLPALARVFENRIFKKRRPRNA